MKQTTKYHITRRPTAYTMMAALLLMGTAGFSQDAKPTEPKTFRELFTEGGYHMEYESFNLAVPVFLEAEKLQPDNANIQYKIGYSYLRFADDKSVAIPYLRKAVKKVTRNYDDLSFTEQNAPQMAYYELARAYHLSDQLDSAISNYKKYAAMLSKKHYMQTQVARQLDMCLYAKEQMAHPVNVKITNMGEKINTKYGDYTPVVTADETMMIFTSRREGSTGGSENLEFDNRFFEDIYITHKKDGEWAAPEQIGGGINTPDHDAVISLSADGQKLFTYNTEGGGDIFLSYRMGDGWTLPDRLGPAVNTPARETHASITPDGKRLFFTSDRGDKKSVQYGGLDIYMSTKLPNGEWSEASNLGAVINTVEDEDAPFIHPNGKRLYFSSKGHRTMGGFDIFYSDLQADGTWSVPVNMGYPINTTKDDIYYVETPSGKRAYYSSVNAELGYGESDLYLIEMPEREKVPLTMLTGIMEVQVEDGIPLEAKIRVKDPNTGEETVYTPNSETGEYLIILPPGTEYEIAYSVEDSVIASEKFDEAKQTDYREVEKMITKEGKIKTSEVAVAVTEPIVVEEPVKPEKKVQKLYLLDAKGTKLMEAALNADGVFVFENLPDMDSYLFKLEPTDGEMIGQDIRVLRTLNGKETILTLLKTEGGLLTFQPEKPVIEEPVAVEPVKAAKIAVALFEQHFGYNVKLIETNGGDYKKMIDAMASNCKQGYKQVIHIEASASKVPTTKYGTNENLAKERGNKTKWVLSRSLENKGVKLDSFEFEISPMVQGPDYKVDAIENREIYKQYQYVKISTR